MSDRDDLDDARRRDEAPAPRRPQGPETLAAETEPHVDTPTWTARAMLPADPTALMAARRMTSGLMVAWDLRDDVERAELVVTELVSNAVRHGGFADEIELDLECRDGLLRIGVSDGSSERPEIRERTADTIGELGLHLVARICRAWGVEDFMFGKRVWADLPLTGPTGPGAVGQAPERTGRI